MFTILINDDGTLTQSIKEKIMHRESNVHTFRFLVEPIWICNKKTTYMRDYDCIFEYRTPSSETYETILLTPSEELYKDKLEYLLPIDINLTCEIGKLNIKFIFTWLEMNEDGNFTEHSRKTLPTSVDILPVPQWSDYISNEKLDNIAQITLHNRALLEEQRKLMEMSSKNS